MGICMAIDQIAYTITYVKQYATYQANLNHRLILYIYLCRDLSMDIMPRIFVMYYIPSL